MAMTLGVVMSLVAQQSSPFSGTWTAEQAGAVFLKISVGGKAPLRIAILTADIRASEQGEITEVKGALGHPEMVLETRIHEGILSMEVRQDDGDIVHYEMRLAGKGEATLQLLDPPNIKPFRLRRIVR